MLSRIQLYALIGIHVVFGLIFSLSSFLGAGLFAIAALYFLVQIFNRPSEIWPLIAGLAYLSGFELCLRIIESPLPYESGKLFCLLLIIVYYIKNPIKIQYRIPLLMVLLLIPSILLIFDQSLQEVRRQISFNLSGLVMMSMGMFVFSHKTITTKDILIAMQSMVLILLTTICIIYILAPDLEEVSFSTESTDELTGGFGANQASTTFSLGALMMALCFWKRIYFINRLFSVIVLMLFLVQAFLSFSRGGVISFAGAAIIGIVIDSVYHLQSKRTYVQVAVVGGLLILGTFLFEYLDSFTGNKLSARYESTVQTEETSDGTETTIDLTGRDMIINADIAIFQRYPALGVGPGQSKEMRIEYGLPRGLAAHTEYSRLLSEHGLMGVMFIILLFWFTFVSCLTQDKYGKIFTVAMGIFCLLTMFHAATRLAAPLALYAIMFARIIPYPQHPLQRATLK